MAFGIKGSHVVAVSLAVGIGAWMLTGEYRIGGTQDLVNQVPPIAEREAERSAEAFKVRYLPLKSEKRSERILVRGRTQAEAIVTVRAETAGVLEKRLIAKGGRVEIGDLVCVIERGDREARLAQAQAQLASAQADYQANVKLKDRGFAPENRITALKSAVDAASAQVAAAEQELKRTEIRANASGIVQDPVAEAGDMLTPGGACVTLVDTDPMLFTGQVSERNIGRVTAGMPASIELVTGATVGGTIRYIAPSADPRTRTFTIEIELKAGTDMRDGMTAQAHLELPAQIAFRIAPAWIRLADDGEIGISTVDESGKVGFTPVRIIAQESDGFWITGPSDGDRIITLGQEYVLPGDTVEAHLDSRFAALLQGGNGGRSASE